MDVQLGGSFGCCMQSLVAGAGEGSILSSGKCRYLASAGLIDEILHFGGAGDSTRRRRAEAMRCYIKVKGHAMTTTTLLLSYNSSYCPLVES